ncbi:MAG: hypothetical protein HW380_921 [Magnetococcales bacterium]|nr:hypothetical protein [Magnetococcales bacterium]
MTKKLDADLEQWLSEDGGEQELILEAVLPSPKLRMARRDLVGIRMPGHIKVPVGIDAVPMESRVEVLQKLAERLWIELGLSANILRAAGSLVVRASAQQTRIILDIPEVGKIRPNRVVHLCTC